MGNTLYLECYSGISGDMAAAALLDLGADQNVLEQALQSLPIDGFCTKISRVKKAGLDACDFHVALDARHENHDHDMQYLHTDDVQHTHMHECGETSHMHAYAHEKAFHTHAHAHDEVQYTQEHLPEEAQHTHEHAHEEAQHTHEHVHIHEHRSLSDILAIIKQADMTDAAKRTAEKIFTILGEAEAKAHGTTLENVHFHEVGAVDSIVDIVAAAVCLDNLAVTDVIIPALYEGGGTIRCQHGILPIPVPAVTNIIQAHHLPLCMTGIQGEFVTPTGAAIAAAVRTGGRLPEQFRIVRTGLGAGKREYERPSILRAMLIEAEDSGTSQLNIDVNQQNAGTSQLNAGINQQNSGASQLNTDVTQQNFDTSQLNAGINQQNSGTSQLNAGINQQDSGASQLNTDVNQQDSSASQLNTDVTQQNFDTNQPNADTIYKLESNIDDCTGEAFGNVMDCLMEAGAKDVFYFPVYMKKNRPAYQLNVLCKNKDIEKLEQIIFHQTTTIGIRRQRMERSILPREVQSVQTAYGEVRVKICRLGAEGQARIYPEYDSLVEICRRSGSSYPEMYHTILQICREKLHLP